MRREELDEDSVTLPRRFLRFPMELVPPAGFDPGRLETWPKVEGTLEFVEGKLLFMPPSADNQQETVADVVTVLGAWVRTHPEFSLGTNEAGIRIGGATRAADAAIWRRGEVGLNSGSLRRVPPLLAVEVAGEDERWEAMQEKARWYLSVGVLTVWLVDPAKRVVTVVDETGERRFGQDAVLPELPQLPGLSPRVADLFFQISQKV